MAVIGLSKHTGLIMTFLSSSEIYVREAGVKALAQIGDQSCVEAVKRLLESETGDSYHSKTIRKYAMLVLQKYSDSGSVPALENTLVRSLENTTNSDESIYAVSALRSVGTNVAREVLEKNAGLITNSEVRSNLFEAVDLPVPAGPAVAPQPVAAEVIPPTPLEETKPEGFIPVTPAAALTKYDFDPSLTPSRYPTPEEALRSLTELSNLASEMEAKLASGDLQIRYFSKLADVYYRMADIFAGLKDAVRSRAYYQLAADAYRKAEGR